MMTIPGPESAKTSPDDPALRGRWWALAANAASFLVVGPDSYIVVTAHRQARGQARPP
jgi:hypothetical protein